MWNPPQEKLLQQIPRLCATDAIPPKEKLIHLHFFFGGCDWYVAEYDGDDLFFGFAVLNDDLANSEWGYISFSELQDINIHGFEVDCDLYWTPSDPQPRTPISKP